MVNVGDNARVIMYNRRPTEREETVKQQSEGVMQCNALYWYWVQGYLPPWCLWWLWQNAYTPTEPLSSNGICNCWWDLLLICIGWLSCPRRGSPPVSLASTYSSISGTPNISIPLFPWWDDTGAFRLSSRTTSEWAVNFWNSGFDILYNVFESFVYPTIMQGFDLELNLPWQHLSSGMSLLLQHPN